MNVGLFIEFIIGVMLSGFAVSRMNEALQLPEIVVCGFSFYFVETCIVSVGLVLLNSFKPVLALSVAVAIPLLFLLVIEHRAALPAFKRMSMSKEMIAILLFLTVMFPVVYQRYEYIEQNGDAGVYSVMAMQYVKNGTLRADLPVWGKLSEQTKELFDPDNRLPGSTILPATEKIEYQFYPGWPVMMAIWGGIFGLENLHYVMIVLYMHVVLLFYFIIKNITPHPFLSLFITAAFGSSPLLVYFTKYPVSELFLLFLLLFCCYNLLQDNRNHTVIAGLTAAAYFLTHVSYFMYLPLFAIAMAMAYTWKKKNILLFCVMAFVGYLLSVPYGRFVSNIYFQEIYRGQFEPFFHQRTAQIAVYVLVSFSAVMAVVSLLLFTRLKKERTLAPDRT